MGWIEVVIEVGREQAESLSDVLMELGALSVSVEDADEGTPAEKPMFGEPGMPVEVRAWDNSRVIALTESTADHAALVKEAAAAIGIAPEMSLPFTTRPLADQDWVRLTQSQFDPIRIGRNICVVPSWHDAPDPNALILELDPGLAFGTGSHPTTCLCMEWLEDHALEGKSVLDYGCGSGILAIVAKKLGAGEVLGVDIDPQAVEAAQFNAERNHCEIALFVPETFTEQHGQDQFDVVVANILAGPLRLLAPVLSQRVKLGGSLVLSGVLAEQASDVIAAYAPAIALSIVAEREGWVALAGLRAN